MEKLLSIKEVSSLLNVKIQTLYSWISIGYIPHVKLRRLVRFKESEIKKWLKEKERSGRKKLIPEVEVES